MKPTKEAAAAARKQATEQRRQANERIRAEQKATRYGSWPAKWINNGAQA